MLKPAGGPGFGMLIPLPRARSDDERPKCFPIGVDAPEPGAALMLRNSFMLSCRLRMLAETSAWGTAEEESMPGR